MLRSEWNEPLRAQRDPLTEQSGRPRSNREQRVGVRKQSGLGKFLATYGWRAYALPVLAVLTVVVLWQTFTGPPIQMADPDVKSPPTIGSSGTAIVGAPPRGLTEFDASLPAGQLPAGGAFTEAGDKTWRIVPGTTPKVGEGSAKTFTYTVDYTGVTISYGGRTVFKPYPEGLTPNVWTAARVSGWFGGNEAAPRTVSYYLKLD